jgi:hypothetical protein
MITLAISSTLEMAIVLTVLLSLWLCTHCTLYCICIFASCLWSKQKCGGSCLSSMVTGPVVRTSSEFLNLRITHTLSIPSSPMDGFVLDKALANPKFEGYKLQIIDQDEAIRRYSLSYLPSQSAATGRSLLTFKEVQSRVSHNHLCVPSTGNSSRALYIDGEYQVVLLEFDSDGSPPQFRVVFTMPRPLSARQTFGSGPKDVHPEYPSASFLDEETCFVSDGYGLLYILQIARLEQATLLGTYQLPNSRPFRIHLVNKISDDRRFAILSFLREKESTDKELDSYEVCAAQFNLHPTTINPSPDEVLSLDIVWQRRGSDAPVGVLFSALSEAYILLGGSPYACVGDQTSEHAYEPTADEIAPIPRAGEDFSSNLGPHKTPPPFSWTQTADSLTVAFPLPASTPKSAMKVSLTNTSFSLRFLYHPEAVEAVTLPFYDSKRFWGPISVEDSLWTWDRDAGHSFGLLTLHLEKAHDSVRWPHLFEPSSQSNEEEDVPETLDPSELVNIRESLEKYTAALQSGEDASGLGLGRGAPSLSQGEMDEEVDSNVGRHTYQTCIPLEDKTNTTMNNTPFTLLSSPLPGSNATDPPSIITKTNVDGNLFCINQAQDTVSLQRWHHQSTFPALAFVLASKRDSRFTYHTHNSVFLWENGTREGTGNMFIYRKTTGFQDLWAKQSVLRITTGGIALLGVGVVSTMEGKKVIACLTEKEVVIVTSIL